MIRKTVVKDTGTIDYKGKKVTVKLMEDQYIDEPISDNICISISDYYNLMHLIKKSWSNEKYELKMDGAGYRIYKNNRFQAWIGVKEKYDSLMFIIFPYGRLNNNAEKIFKGYMKIFDSDEDQWIYSELDINDILQEKSFEEQKMIIEKWLKENIEKIL